MTVTDGGAPVPLGDGRRVVVGVGLQEGHVLPGQPLLGRLGAHPTDLEKLVINVALKT